MRHLRNLAASLGALTLLIGIPVVAAGQTYSVTPTYQTSVRAFDPGLPNATYRAWGVMVGQTTPGRWWSPHVWVQRFDHGIVCRGDQPGGESCGNEGWSFSVGPAIEFVDTGRVIGSFVSQVGLQSRGERDLTGGGGIHVGVRAGRFQPQAFGRVQLLRGQSFVTLGFGVRFELRRY